MGGSLRFWQGVLSFGRCWLPANPAFSLLPCPPSPARARRALFPGGEGGDQGYFMQGASPLASPGAEPGRHGSRWRFPHPEGACPLRRRLNLPPRRPRGAYLFSRLLTPPLVCFSAPYPPDPLPRRGRGCPKVYFAGGFAPGTPALNRLRHVQTLPSRHPAG